MAISAQTFLRHKATEERSRRVDGEAQNRPTTLSTEAAEPPPPGETTHTPPDEEEPCSWPSVTVPNFPVEEPIPPSPKDREKSPPSLSWDSETAALVEWFLAALTLPEEPFLLAPWDRVVDLQKFYHALRMDIAAGPQSPRAPSLREDLHRLFGVCLETSWKREYPMDTKGGRIT